MIGRGGRTSQSSRRALLILPIWITLSVWMWFWWLFESHIRYIPLFIPLTLALLYEFVILPSIFLYFVMKAKSPPKRIAQKNKKVAVISLCVPSTESLDIVEKQLIAMSQITYPHDSWILDEGNNPTIKAMARKHGVKHFTRKGIKKYNLSFAPFKKKTKAGNVNAWLEHVKRRKYDFFVQLDIDHIPNTNYLHKTLGYFRDPAVAWVQAPSIYKNRSSWIARGAAEQELVLQGPLQMGFYGHSQIPFIIGSHCTYRMSAIREIGGFQPTRAEDHLDTVYLAHNGYKGVFLPEIIAEGDGPETLSIYLAQQFAWAYSMLQVLVGHSPRLLKSMPWKVKWQFLFAQTWYPLWTLSYLIMFTTPLLALLARRDVVELEPLQMLIHFAPVYIGGFIIWWTAMPIMKPGDLRLSWRGMILHTVRWPIIFKAVIAVIFKVKKPYMVTPKGKFAHSSPSLKTYQPFLLLGMMSGIFALYSLFSLESKSPFAQVIFAITNSIFMLTICTVDIGIRIHNIKPKVSDLKKYWLKPISATASLALIILVSFVSSYTTFISPPAVASTKNDESIVSPQSVHYGMTTKELLDQLELVPARYKSQPRIGIYNPTFELPDKKQDYIQHSFVDWRDEHYLAYALSSTAQSGNIPLITIEPRGELDGSILLNDIVMGKYDERLNNIKTILSASKNPVYIRFAHEMELANLYAWGDQDSELFISAYKHVADILRTDSSNNTFLVWSPAGNIGAEKYYPGDQYVDVIGTTILYDEYFYGERVPSFEELAYGRKWLQVFNKPVWIVEFGAGNSNSTIQRLLIEEARAKYSDYGYSALIYLNLIDANIVGPDYRLRSYNDFYQLFDIGTRSEIDSLTCNLRQPYYSNHAERILGSPRPEAVCSDSQIQE